MVSGEQFIISDKIKPRLKFIELLTYWEGGINASHLVTAFHISRQQAIKDFQKFNQYTHDLKVYDKYRKLYIPQREQKLSFISGDVSEYLNWITGITAAGCYPFTAAQY